MKRNPSRAPSGPAVQYPSPVSGTTVVRVATDLLPAAEPTAARVRRTIVAPPIAEAPLVKTEPAANVLLFVANRRSLQSPSEKSRLLAISPAKRSRSMENRRSVESLLVENRSVTSPLVIGDPAGNPSREKALARSPEADLLENSAASPLGGPAADRLSATGHHSEKDHPKDALRVPHAPANPSLRAALPAEHLSAIVLRVGRPAAVRRLEKDHPRDDPRDLRAPANPSRRAALPAEHRSVIVRQEGRPAVPAADRPVVGPAEEDPEARDQVAVDLLVDAPPVADRLAQDRLVESRLVESPAANRVEAALPAAASINKFWRRPIDYNPA